MENELRSTQDIRNELKQHIKEFSELDQKIECLLAEAKNHKSDMVEYSGCIADIERLKEEDIMLAKRIANLCWILSERNEI